MSDGSQRSKAIADLAEAISQGRGALFVGAGISAMSGLPTWKGLLTELIALLPLQPGIDKQVIEDAKVMLDDKSKWLVLAQLVRNELGKDFTDFINRRLTDKANKPNVVHSSLVEISWSAIVTTNYDRLIERAFAQKFGGDTDTPVISYQKPSLIASNYRRGVQFILKAHGDAREDPESVVLTESDYRRLIHREIGFQTILQSIFTTNSFLFLGCSLSDPDLRLLLGFLHSAFHGDTPTHYALVPSDERLNAEDRILKSDFGIHVVPIDPQKREEETLLFLEDLRTKLESLQQTQ